MSIFKNKSFFSMKHLFSSKDIRWVISISSSILPWFFSCVMASNPYKCYTNIFFCRQVCNARLGAEAALRQPPARPRDVGRHHRRCPGHPQRSHQEARGVLQVRHSKDHVIEWKCDLLKLLSDRCWRRGEWTGWWQSLTNGNGSRPGSSSLPARSSTPCGTIR